MNRPVVPCALPQELGLLPRGFFAVPWQSARRLFGGLRAARVGRTRLALASIVAVLPWVGFTSAPVKSWAGPPEEVEGAAAKPAPPPEALEDVANRLKKATGIETIFLRSKPGGPFTVRREIHVAYYNWFHGESGFSVIPSSPADKVGEKPADFLGAAIVKVLATDGRYTVVAGWNYDPEVANKILAALGQTLSKEAETKRLSQSAARNWLDFRLAVAKDSGPRHETPQPLAHGPTPAQIEDYTKLFLEKGPNGGRRRGDPYLWFSPLHCCEISPLLVTTEERGFRNLIPKGSRGVISVLLSDKPDEVLVSGSKRPRPWHLTRVEATRDAQGRHAVELKFDAVAAAQLAKLTEANSGRALAVVFNDQVVQVQVIDRKLSDTMVISGKAFDEKLVAGFVRSLRECMMEPAAAAASSNAQDISADDAVVGAELKAVRHSLESALEKLEPKAKFDYHDKTLVVTYLPQTFKIHRNNKAYEFSAKAYDEIGPSHEGFILHAHLQPRGEVNQVILPATIRRPYWLMDLDVTPIGKADKQVYWALSYGARTDKGLLNKIRLQFKTLSESSTD